MTTQQKRLIAVLHMVEPDAPEAIAHALSQAKLAADAGADGFALVPAVGGMRVKVVNAAAQALRDAFADKWLVVNYLCGAEMAVSSVPACVDALWTDRGVAADGTAASVRAASEALRRSPWKGKFCPGYFHKGSPRTLPASDDDLRKLADDLLAIGDWPVTTGAGTGVAADATFLRRIHASIAGRAPLTIASGITTDNVAAYLPYVDDFLVGTGIERTSTNAETVAFYREAGLAEAVDVGHLDPDKVKALADAIHHAAAGPPAAATAATTAPAGAAAAGAAATAPSAPAGGDGTASGGDVVAAIAATAASGGDVAAAAAAVTA